MFNLPWYAWLNVLALPCLWLSLMLDCALQGRPQWFRHFTTISLLACIVSVFLYWNPHVNALFSPLQPGLIILIVLLVACTLITQCLQLLISGMRWWKHASNGKEEPSAAPSPADHAVTDEQRGKAMTGLFSPKATLDESLNNLLLLTGVQDDDETPGVLIPLQLIQLLLSGLILIPPMLLSFHLVRQ